MPTTSSTPLMPVSASSPSAASQFTMKNITIPTVWSAETQKYLNEKRSSKDVRKEIVRTMSVIMIAAGPESTTNLQCERVANTIIAQYPFLADPYAKSQAVS